MNSKEALARLTYCVNDMESEEKYYKTIKKDLDRLEELEKENQELKENSKEICECDVDRLNKIDKDLKALEIIKEHSFMFVEKGQLYVGRYGDIELLLEEDDFEDKHEYELLKEVFGND